MTEHDVAMELHELLSPYALKRFAEVKDKGLKVAHYTSAESAALIIQNKTIWLRNAAMMNDFSEIAYGKAQLESVLDSGLEQRLEAALTVVHPELMKEVRQWLVDVDRITREQTYLMSVAAHHPDDHLGKLSMWRAYGGTTSGVALVFNTEVFEHDSDALGAHSSPVLYGDSDDLTKQIEIVVANVENNIDKFKNVSSDTAKSILFTAFQYWILSTKHPAFREEEEWRVIHMPFTAPSAFIPTSIRVVRGIPQMVCEVKLQNQPNLDMPWLELDRLLYRVIIGPCAYPEQVRWAFIDLLKSAGVSDPVNRVSVAYIPLRQQG